MQNKTETFFVSVTRLNLKFDIVQNKFQQTKKTKINHINYDHIKFEVSLHFRGIWPTVCHAYSLFSIKRTIFFTTVTVVKNTVRLIGNIE